MINNRVILIIVHLSFLLNVLLLVANFTFPKTAEKIYLEDVSSKGRDSHKSRKLYLAHFNDFTIYSNVKGASLYTVDDNYTFYTLKNNVLGNRVYIERVSEKDNTKSKAYIGYHCYNSYFVYFLFLGILAYVGLFFLSNDEESKKAIPYIAIPIIILFLINILVQFK